MQIITTFFLLEFHRDYKAESQKHQSQKDYKGGFGGEFGVQTDRQDKSAVGW